MVDMYEKIPKIVITDCDHPSVEIEKEVLKVIPHELVEADCQKEEDVINIAQDAVALINQYAPITNRVIESLKECKVIVRYGVGVDNIDVEAAKKHGIIVANVPDYCIDEVSTHTMALALNCARKITLLDKNIQHQKWDFSKAKPIFRTLGKTFGLLGLGKIARAVARKAIGFGFNVIAYDPYISEVNLKIKLVPFHQLLEDADFISIHAPLTNKTRYLFSEKEFSAMKKNAYLINTARGSIIDEKALYKALKEKWIAGAALDVMENEPPKWDSSLLKLDNLILTPHISFYSEDSYIELKTKVAEAVIAVLKGKQPLSIVNS